MVTDVICTVCKDPVTAREHAISCDVCKMWMHRRHTNISQTDFRRKERELQVKYICIPCEVREEIWLELISLGHLKHSNRRSRDVRGVKSSAAPPTCRRATLAPRLTSCATHRPHTTHGTQRWEKAANPPLDGRLHTVIHEHCIPQR